MSPTSKTQTAKGETQPRLRFPEFQNAGEWEWIELGEKVDLLSGYPFDGPDISQDSSGIPLLRGINVTEGRIRHNPEIDRYYPGSTETLEKFRLQANDLVIGMDGSKVGKNSALVSEADAGALLIQRVARLRAKKAAMIQFIFQRIHSPSFHAYVDRINTSSGIPHISAKQIKEFRICFPSPAEQQKIAECFSSVDDLMAAQARKLDALKTHKKGLMQQLFPREGETQPLLRFPEFQNAGEWVVKPLGEVVELQSGFAFSSSNFGSEGRKLVTPKNFTKHGHGNFDESVSKYTTEDVPERFVCKPGDLLVLLTDLTPTCELLGKPLLLEEKDGTVLLNQRVVRVEPSASEVEALFLRYVFLSETYCQRIIKTATGSTVKHSSNKVLQEMPLFHPTLPEQHRIATCLSSLDALITAETQKHEALKTHKRGLMQQLFPSPEDSSQ